MKHFPIPDSPLKTDEEIKDHFTDLVFNVMSWLKVDGYAFYVVLPGQDGFVERKDAGACIVVEFPYKKFHVSIQQDSLNKCRNEPLSNTGYWDNIETSMFHEVIHILVWRLAEIAGRRFTTPTDIEDAEEELTDHFAHLIHALVRDGRRMHEKLAKSPTPKKRK